MSEIIDIVAIEVGVTVIDVRIDPLMPEVVEFAGVVGPKGDTGTQGPQGPQGAASTVPGPIGPQGPQGLTGADSTVPGPPGATGPPGSTGPAGPASTVPGPSGSTGPAGATGPTGPAGAASTVPGPQGPSGTAGAQGPAGQGVPVGGTTGQILSKINATDYNTQWSTASGGGTAASTTFTPAGNIAATDVQAALVELDNEKVAKAGDTMTGNLVLPAGTGALPSLNFTGATTNGLSSSASNLNLSIAGVARLQITGTGIVSTVQYKGADGTVAVPSYSFNNEAGSGLYRKAAGSISITATNNEVMNWAAASKVTTAYGPIVLPADPTTALQAATKQYVDNKPGGAIVSDTAPVGAAAGALWWESDTGLFYVNYFDGDSTQWIMAMPVADATLYAVRFDTAQALTLAQQAQARTNIGVAQRGYMHGLGLSTAGGVNTFTAAAGVATDSTNSAMLTLSAPLLKGYAAWAAGSGGALDTGTATINTWYHAYVIQRPDTGVVDIAISLSASAPVFGVNIPAAYTLFRRLGAMKINPSSLWTKFIQDGDTFIWDLPTADINAANPGTAAVTRTINTPPGVRVEGIFMVGFSAAVAADNPAAILLTDLALADTSPGVQYAGFYCYASGTLINNAGGQVRVFTNTSSQIRSRIQISAAGTSLFITTFGWIDRRGRDS